MSNPTKVRASRRGREKKEERRPYPVSIIESWPGLSLELKSHFFGHSVGGEVDCHGFSKCPTHSPSLGSLSPTVPFSGAAPLYFGCIFLSSLALGIQWYLKLLSLTGMCISLRGLWEKAIRLSQASFFLFLASEWVGQVSAFHAPPSPLTSSGYLVVLNTVMFCFATRETSPSQFCLIFLRV